MVGQISTRARNYVRRRATAQMTHHCRIERITNPTFVETADDLLASPGDRTLIYEGICRLWEVAGNAAAVQVGQDEFVMQTTQLAIPWDSDPVPFRDDEVEITDSSTDAHMVGRRYRIMDVAKAGDLRASRRFQLQGLQENESWLR